MTYNEWTVRDPETYPCDAREGQQTHLIRPRLTEVQIGGHPHAEWVCVYCGRDQAAIREQERQRGQ